MAKIRKGRTIVIDAYRLLELGDLSLNVAVFPGDVVSVPRAGTFYVSGHVYKSGEFPLKRRMTILAALSVANGLKFTADPTDVRLYRLLGNDRQIVLSYNVKAIAKGRAEDLVLQPGDRIEVPGSIIKTFLYGIYSFLHFSAGASANVTP